MAKKLGDFKRGQGAYWRDGIWVFMNMSHVKPGKGPAYLQCELRNVKTQQIVSNRFRPEETLEPVHFDRKKYEYLYSDQTNHIFMDVESYEQYEMPVAVIGDQSVYLTPNCEVEVCMVGNDIISADLPSSVELTVTDCPPNVKGATATNQLKDATCEGGARVKVPPFVETGTVIKVDTRTGEYLGRV